jgi:chemotaxis response regulator CheB
MVSASPLFPTNRSLFQSSQLTSVLEHTSLTYTSQAALDAINAMAEPDSQSPKTSPVPVCGIGASAGGLEALHKLESIVTLLNSLAKKPSQSS